MALLDIIENIVPTKAEQKEEPKERKIAHHIFGGSTTMIGVCITIIALFKTMKAGDDTYADELLSIGTFFFIASSMLSYLSLRNNDNRRLEWLADIIFFLGMIIMLLVGVLIVFTDL